MKTTLITLKLPAILTVLGLTALVSHAQPNLGAAKGDNPPNRTPREMVRNMAPQQRTAMMQGRLEEQLQNRRADMLRQSLTQTGFDDKAMQDDIVDFSNQQIKAALTLREKTSKVSDAVADKATPDTQISALLNDLHAAQDDEKTRREAAEKALNEKLGYSQKPRLEALLTTLNLIGENSNGLLNMMSAPNGGRINGGAIGGAQRGGFGGGGLGAGGFRANGFGGRGFGANQNAGGAQNAPGNDVFGLRRQQGLRLDRGARRERGNGNNDNADKNDAQAKPETKPEAKTGA